MGLLKPFRWQSYKKAQNAHQNVQHIGRNNTIECAHVQSSQDILQNLEPEQEQPQEENSSQQIPFNQIVQYSQQFLTTQAIQSIQCGAKISDKVRCINYSGFLRTKWDLPQQNPHYQVLTATPIAPRILVTNAHGMIHDVLQQICTSSEFKLVGGDFDPKAVFKIKAIKMSKFHQEQDHKQPQYLAGDIAILLLDRPLPSQRYLKVSKGPPKLNDALHLSGFPGCYRYYGSSLNGVFINRVSLSGSCCEVDEKSKQFVHDMNTQEGHSGSPIVKKNQEGIIEEMVGMHYGISKGGYEKYGLMMNMYRKKILKRACDLLIMHPLKKRKEDISEVMDSQIEEMFVIQEVTEDEKAQIMNQKKQGEESEFLYEELESSSVNSQQSDMQMLDYDDEQSIEKGFPKLQSDEVSESQVEEEKQSRFRYFEMNQSSQTNKEHDNTQDQTAFLELVNLSLPDLEVVPFEALELSESEFNRIDRVSRRRDNIPRLS